MEKTLSRPRFAGRAVTAVCGAIALVTLAGCSSRPAGGAATVAASFDRGHDAHPEHGASPERAALRRAVLGPSADVSRTPTPAFDARGRLWLAWVEGRHVLVSSSKDLGRTFAPAVTVNAVPEDVDANSESRPKIAAGRGGEIYVTYTRLGARRYTGDVRFSRSTDGGRTFAPPVTLNDDHLDTGHRFDALAVRPDGTVFVSWIDKRDLEAAGMHAGAAVYYTVSRDAGRTFEPNRRLASDVCECCRLAPAFDTDSRLTLAWRAVLPGGVRDHAIGWISRDGSAASPERATVEGWKIDACPHHGPSLAISADGTYHLVWFTGEGPRGAGAFYAFSLDRGRTFSAPRRLGLASGEAHGMVVAAGRHVFLAWKQRDEAGSAVYVQRSDDDGVNWSEPEKVLSTSGSSDHPQLTASPTGVFLSWFTTKEGYRLAPLVPPAS